MPAGIAPVVARSLWCFLWSFLCGDSIDDRSWRATQRGLERPRYKHTTLLYSLAVKVFEFPPSRRLVRVCRGKFVRSSEPSGDFALTGRSPRVSLLLDKLLSPKSLLSDSHPSVSKPSSRSYRSQCSLVRCRILRHGFRGSSLGRVQQETACSRAVPLHREERRLKRSRAADLWRHATDQPRAWRRRSVRGGE